MRRVAFFVALLCLGMMAVPGLAQEAGLEDAAETVDPTGEASAHYEAGCLKGPCVCYFGPPADPIGYHCHDGY